MTESNKSGDVTARTYAPRSRPKKIREPEFARRLNLELDNTPLCPPLHHGRLKWIRDEFERRFGISFPNGTIGKWVEGQVKPQADTMSKLAQMLEVSEAWLSLGVGDVPTPRETKARSAELGGAVHLLAGMILLNGALPAFPTDDDARAKESFIDLYAIIRGTQYAFHVSMGSHAGDGCVKFQVPLNHLNAFQVGVIQTGDLDFKVVEIIDEFITEGVRKGGAIEVTVTPAQIDEAQIRNFRNRL
jgi:hypothetical protein